MGISLNSINKIIFSGEMLSSLEVNFGCKESTVTWLTITNAKPYTIQELYGHRPKYLQQHTTKPMI
jgi:hypothetical protein